MYVMACNLFGSMLFWQSNSCNYTAMELSNTIIMLMWMASVITALDFKRQQIN